VWFTCQKSALQLCKGANLCAKIPPHARLTSLTRDEVTLDLSEWRPPEAPRSLALHKIHRKHDSTNDTPETRIRAATSARRNKTLNKHWGWRPSILLLWATKWIRVNTRPRSPEKKINKMVRVAWSACCPLEHCKLRTIEAAPPQALALQSTTTRSTLNVDHDTPQAKRTRHHGKNGYYVATDFEGQDKSPH